MVLVTACRAANPREGIDFLPLTVDYREYTYASGRIPGGFFKREGKPTEKEVLTSRLIDRPIRPLFPAGWRYETQIIALVLSADTENDTDVLAITGASAALALSEIPFQKTIAGVRVGLVDGAVRHQPDLRAAQAEPPRPHRRRQHGRHRDGRGRREGSRPKRRSSQALETGARRHQADRRRHRRPREGGRQDEAARSPKKEIGARVLPRGRGEGARAAHRGDAHPRQARELRPRRRGARGTRSRRFPRARCERKVEAKAIFKELKEKVLRDEVLERGVRLDGRKFDEIRPIWIEVGVLPRDARLGRVHARRDAGARHRHARHRRRRSRRSRRVDGDGWKRFMLHYNFPPFSVGEVAFLRGPGRREIGHGALAERALTPMMPAEEKFPYTVRIVSDILESNGSSSMASVCGGSLAMMDAGVPLKAPVAGIAMGLVMDEKTGKYAVLTDIAGAEDHYGDMDFKVAGTAEGITALQMDIKVGGHHRRGHAQGARAGARAAACTSSSKMRETLATPRGRASRRSRRASSRSRSRSTRSATSSGPAAR